jgi:hypothetical protein
MVPYGDEGYLLPASHYRPLVISEGAEKIPPAQFQKAAEEYEKRSSRKESSGAVLPILVAVGVKDSTFRYFLDDETGPMKKADYLFLPSICWQGRSGALFMTYMPGPIDGSVDVRFHLDAEKWRDGHDGLSLALNSGCSSGAHNAVQPDYRLWPNPKYRDKNGNDEDRAHKGLPHTRLYWEIEYNHRKVVALSEHGAKLMRRSDYTRFFIGATISEPDDVDAAYEAAIVLWGKDDSTNEISVLEAVSFGTKDLSDETKEAYSKSQRARLPAVGVDEWRRPENAGALPVERPTPTPEEWLLRIPSKGILYKVMTGKRNQDGDRTYFWDTLAENEIGDMVVDLLRMSYGINLQSVPIGTGDSTDEENEDS